MDKDRCETGGPTVSQTDSAISVSVDRPLCSKLFSRKNVDDRMKELKEFDGVVFDETNNEVDELNLSLAEAVIEENEEEEKEIISNG